MPGTTDLNGPPADANDADPDAVADRRRRRAGTTTTQSVSLYNTSTTPTTVTGTWRKMGPQSNIGPVVTENVSAPPFGTPVPPVGATAAAPISFNVPAGLDRMEMSEIEPDPTNNTMLLMQLFNPQGTFVQESYDDGSTSQNVTSLGATNVIGATNIKVVSVTDAVVGNQVDIDTLTNAETATIAAVGKAETNTTLSATANQGSTNIKVAADSSITAGDTITINAGATNAESDDRHGRRQHRRDRRRRHAGPSGLQFAHVGGSSVFDAGTGVSADHGPEHRHATGAEVVFFGNGSEANYDEMEVAAPEPGTWTVKFYWNGIDQDESSAPPLPGAYTGPMSVPGPGLAVAVRARDRAGHDPRAQQRDDPDHLQVPRNARRRDPVDPVLVDQRRHDVVPVPRAHDHPDRVQHPVQHADSQHAGPQPGPGADQPVRHQRAAQLGVDLGQPDHARRQPANKFSYYLVGPADLGATNTTRRARRRPARASPNRSWSTASRPTTPR